MKEKKKKKAGKTDLLRRALVKKYVGVSSTK